MKPARTAEAAQHLVAQLVEQALELVGEEQELWNSNAHSASRVLGQAYRVLVAQRQALGTPLTHRGAASLEEAIYDAEALCEAAVALDPVHRQGQIAARVRKALEGTHELLDQPAGFWPEEVAAERAAGMPDPLAGYTRQQAADIFQVIARKADQLYRMLMDLVENVHERPGPEVVLQIELAQTVTETVGMLADRASGAEVCGDVDHWFMGPNFHKARA